MRWVEEALLLLFLFNLGHMIVIAGFKNTKVGMGSQGRHSQKNLYGPQGSLGGAWLYQIVAEMK
jgi:hypothetical protein